MKNWAIFFTIPQLIFSAPTEFGETRDVGQATLGTAPQFTGSNPTLEMIPPPSFKIEPPQKSPTWAATLSSIFPGFGHAYLGDKETAAQLFATGTATLTLAFVSDVSPSFTKSNLATFQSASFYSIYAAYRDARILNGINNYSYKMPTDSFADLTKAPFRWSVLKKPEVWGGFLGALGLAVGATYCYDRFVGEVAIRPQFSSKYSPFSPAVALPVGIGEEAFFHGYLQTQISENISPSAGILFSGLLFGAAHIPNALALPEESRWGYYTFSLPLITAFGTYTAWLTNKNHSIQEGVAIHSWYDFVVFSISALSNEWASTGNPGFAFAITF